MDNNKKIFDIVPPKNKETSPLLKKADTFFKKTPALEIKKEIKSAKPSPLKKILILFVFLALIFVLISQFVLNKTEVRLWLKTEKVSLNEEITVNTSKGSVDVSGKIIPGRIFEKEVSVLQEFPASGKTEEGARAAGKIRVFNDYSDVQQILIINTRFISADGKLFRTTERVVVPGQPGYVDVNVIADQPGDSYNIGPTTFSIPGFVGTPKYTGFYGKSSEPMTGGFSGESAQIQKEDLDKAKESLTNKATEEGKALLQSSLPADFRIADNMVYSEIVESTSSLPAGAKVAAFNYQVKLKLKAIGFGNSDLENFSKELIISQYDSEKKIKDGSLKVSWEGDSLDLKNGKMVLGVNISADIYSGINEEQLRQSLVDIPLSEAQKIISYQPEIAKVQIKSWPFWAGRTTKEKDKVNIELILD